MSADELSKLKEGDCSANTLKNNMWALKLFEEWRVTRNTWYPADPCPEEILITDNRQILFEWLCKFILEACKANGQEYTPCTLYVLDFSWTPEAHLPSEIIRKNKYCILGIIHGRKHLQISLILE